MNYSLNETEAMAKRAARGAGYSWGLAEEAGKAVRWLCINGLDGCGILARLLDRVDTGRATGLSPMSVAEDWSGASGQLCPLIAGASLSDHASLLRDREIVMRNVLFPALVLPFAAAAAATSETAVSVNWDGKETVCLASGLCRANNGAALAALKCTDLRVTLGGTAGPAIAPARRTSPAAADLAILNRFAHRTYAPATEASRLLGAGAGMTDND